MSSSVSRFFSAEAMMTQPCLIAVWHQEGRFEYLARDSAKDSRPHVRHDDYGDRGFTGSVAITQQAGDSQGQRAIFRWADHFKRFEQTAAAIASIRQIPCSRELLTKVITELVSRNDQSYIRCSIGGGGEVKVYAPGEPVQFHICTEPIDPITRSYLGERVAREGMRVLVTDWRRGYPDAVTQAKCTANYVRSINAKDEAVQQGYDEGALLDWTGARLSEISVANLILIKGQHAFTPHAQSGALNSITRQTAETLLKDTMNISTDPILVGPKEIADADEIMACGTAIGCLRVTEMDWSSKGVHWKLRRGSTKQIVPDIDAAYCQLLQGLRPNYHPEWLMTVTETRSVSIPS